MIKHKKKFRILVYFTARLIFYKVIDGKKGYTLCVRRDHILTKDKLDVMILKVGDIRSNFIQTHGYGQITNHHKV